MDQLAEVDTAVGIGIDADPYGWDFYAVRQGLHLRALEIAEDDGCRRHVFEHVFPHRCEIGATTTDDDDLFEGVFFMELVDTLDAVIEQDQCQQLGLERVLDVLDFRVEPDDFAV